VSVIEWHGWATISDSPSQDDQWPDPMVAALEHVHRIVADYGDRPGEVVDLRNLNGSWQLWLSGSHNHVALDVRGLYEAVAEAAPGSYGTLLIHDGEHAERANEWTVWVMRRGRVSERRDQDLSPHIGAVEDPFQP